MENVDVSTIEGVTFTRLLSNQDERGTFRKTFPQSSLRNSLDSIAVSINEHAGVIRGIHFQIHPFAEEKLVSCIKGSTFEVIVDLRPSSKTLGKVATFELSEENCLQVHLPEGVAHGYQTLTSHTIVHYCLTSAYSPDHSYSIYPLAELGISWPIKNYSISSRDNNGIRLEEAIFKYSKSLIS